MFKKQRPDSYTSANGITISAWKIGGSLYAELYSTDHKWDIYRFTKHPIKGGIRKFLKSLEFLKDYDFNMPMEEFQEKYSTWELGLKLASLDKEVK